MDDIHFLAPSHADTNAVKMANHLKFLASTFPVTLIYVGVGVSGRGLLTEGRAPQQALQAQFGRRTTALTMRPFSIQDEPGRQEWRRLLLSIERQLVLAARYPGMLADGLADYLFARSTGHFASLMALISRGCLRAIRIGAERLDTALMDQVKNDAAAEADRQELLAAIRAALLTSRPARIRAAALRRDHQRNSQAQLAREQLYEPDAGERLAAWPDLRHLAAERSRYSHQKPREAPPICAAFACLSAVLEAVHRRRFWRADRWTGSLGRFAG
ncbi:MAG TPA: hypothetical protein DHU96_01975 [Actinobacteria bacterium]|nr:hypothetical protein [Actinomycetota bacterium]